MAGERSLSAEEVHGALIHRVARVVLGHERGLQEERRQHEQTKRSEPDAPRPRPVGHAEFSIVPEHEVKGARSPPGPQREFGGGARHVRQHRSEQEQKVELDHTQHHELDPQRGASHSNRERGPKVLYIFKPHRHGDERDRAEQHARRASHEPQDHNGVTHHVVVHPVTCIEPTLPSIFHHISMPHASCLPRGCGLRRLEVDFIQSQDVYSESQNPRTLKNPTASSNKALSSYTT